MGYRCILCIDFRSPIYFIYLFIWLFSYSVSYLVCYLVGYLVSYLVGYFIYLWIYLYFLLNNRWILISATRVSVVKQGKTFCNSILSSYQGICVKRKFVMSSYGSFLLLFSNSLIINEENTQKKKKPVPWRSLEMWSELVQNFHHFKTQFLLKYEFFWETSKLIEKLSYCIVFQLASLLEIRSNSHFSV